MDKRISAASKRGGREEPKKGSRSERQEQAPLVKSARPSRRSSFAPGGEKQSGRAEKPASSSRSGRQESRKPEPAQSARAAARKPEPATTGASRRSARDPEPASRSARKSVREKPNEKSARLSGRSSQRGGGREQLSSDERKALAVERAEKELKKKITLGVAIGVVLLGALIAYGPVQRHMLFSKLATGDASARASAVAALTEWKDAVVPGFGEAVRGIPAGKWSDDSRLDAAGGLMAVGTPGAVKELADIARAGGDKPTEDDAKARYAVLAAVAGSDKFMSRCAGSLPPELFISHAGSENKAARVAAGKGLQYYRGAAVSQTLLTLLGDAESEVRLNAATSMCRIADKSDLPGLLGLLNSGNSAKIDAAQIVLSSMRSPDTVKALGEFLPKAGEPLQTKILEIYGKYGRLEAMEPYVSQIIAEAPLGVRIAALELTGKLSLTGCAPAVVEAMKSETPELREAAAVAAAGCDAPPVRIQLYLAVNDAVSKVCRAALVSVRTLGDRKATGNVIKLLDSDDVDNQREAVKTLCSLFPKSAENKSSGGPAFWKNWNLRFKDQQAFVDYVTKTDQKLRDLMGNQNNESYKEAHKIIQEIMPLVDQFLADKMTYENGKPMPLVPELKDQYLPIINSIQNNDLRPWLYDSNKLQTNSGH